jgi:hypothetical protein
MLEEKVSDKREIRELRAELIRQWAANHHEHCGALMPPWPHAGDCHWPLPPVIAAVEPSRVLRILLSASEESV